MPTIFDEIVFEGKRKITEKKPNSAIHCISAFLAVMFGKISGTVYPERYEPAEMRMTGKVKQPH